MVNHGIVEDVNDPLGAGRVRVRIFGLHTDDLSLLPTSDLPWAQVEQSVNSASMSGIGYSAHQLLPGSWVTVDFFDHDKQYPMVRGTLAGIPRPDGMGVALEEAVFNPNTLSYVTTEDGTPVQTEDGTPVSTTTDPATPIPPLTGARRARDFTSVSSNCVNVIKQFEGFRATAYLDTNKKYSIGYGTQTMDGKPISPNQVINEATASRILIDDINQTRLPSIHSNVRVLVTQSMVDALCCFAYNVGTGAFSTSTLLSDLNSEKYLQAAARFNDWTKAGGKTLPGLVARRKAEMTLFLSEGTPSPLGGIEKQAVDGSSDSTSTNGTPTNSTPTQNAISAEKGFSDPSGKYPLYRNEPDTNRLARHNKIKDTIVFKKEAARDLGVPIAGSTETWDQSKIPYNAKYPYNRMYCSESGHVIEYDDTPNSRRLHEYHASGTFREIDDNGTRVNRIVGDDYEILERNGHVHIKGKLNVTVDGAYNLKVQSAGNIDIDGALTINVFNDAILNISGNAKTSIGGDYLLKVGGIFGVDAKMVYYQSGKTDSIKAPAKAKTVSEKTFSNLTVVTRGTEPSMQYETPDEGDPTSYDATMVANGEVQKEDLTNGKAVTKETLPPPVGTVTTTDCKEIHMMTEFPPDYVLSKHYTIGHMNKNGSRVLVPQLGLKPDQIACNLKLLAINALEPIRNMYPNMILTSVFRRPGDAVNSSKTSDHYIGCAADMQFPGYSRSEYIDIIKRIQEVVPYDQLILEYLGTTTWIHISFKSSGLRKQVFTMSNHKMISKMGEIVLIN